MHPDRTPQHAPHAAISTITTAANAPQCRPSAMYSLLTPVQLAGYFARIGFTGAAPCTLATLQQLQTLHSIAIAFDNLDAWLGKVPSLAEDAVYDKLVQQGRGGYCFEHNQLFMRVLLTLGFPVRAIGARVLFPGIETPRNHHAILVDLPQGRFLADVGFGGIELTVPLSLDESGPQQAMHERWRIEPSQRSVDYVLCAETDGEWVGKYSFHLAPQTAADYDMANWFVATHPESFLVQNLLAARVDAEGRHALLNTNYTRYRKGAAPESILIGSPGQLVQLLRERFRINTAAIAGLEQRAERLCQKQAEVLS